MSDTIRPSLRLDLYGLDEAKDNRHPQVVMQSLGITYQHATPQSMGDQWWFWNCENVPDPLPKFLSVLEIDPMACIGWGLSREDAEKIAAGRVVTKEPKADV